MVHPEEEISQRIQTASKEFGQCRNLPPKHYREHTGGSQERVSPTTDCTGSASFSCRTDRTTSDHLFTLTNKDDRWIVQRDSSLGYSLERNRHECATIKKSWQKLDAASEIRRLNFYPAANAHALCRSASELPPENNCGIFDCKNLTLHSRLLISRLSHNVTRTFA